MRKSAPIEVVVHYPETREGWEELGKRVATAHANYVIEKIERMMTQFAESAHAKWMQKLDGQNLISNKILFIVHIFL